MGTAIGRHARTPVRYSLHERPRVVIGQKCTLPRLTDITTPATNIIFLFSFSGSGPNVLKIRNKIATDLQYSTVILAWVEWSLHVYCTHHRDMCRKRPLEVNYGHAENVRHSPYVNRFEMFFLQCIPTQQN